jgi:hypothetical protein
MCPEKLVSAFCVGLVYREEAAGKETMRQGRKDVGPRTRFVCDQEAGIIGGERSRMLIYCVVNNELSWVVWLQ